ncbi:aldo/keto reductase [Lysinibacter sp. HNR]|uniref:aldo/keto reductase n=1 Tax=Lysinibacter sp. HNR TaxID=3031408 RepID=UPI0024353E50|nr:aldo/keto reductase [Lysinibacter sp. HNR]WGD36510.1 aldo/keto reductase [Lysinibacter sp. HNR]
MTHISGSRYRAVGSSDLMVSPLGLGGNVFGWTADRTSSFDVLDAFFDKGGNFVDTADGYSHWAPGNTGGESEETIGAWMDSRGNRDEVIVATKVSTHPKYEGLAGANIRAAADASLRRLNTDYIDLYYAHFDDPQVPLEETLTAFNSLIEAGKVRFIGISNYSATRIDEWMSLTEENSFYRPVALQPHYNLMERDFESELRIRAQKYNLGVFPYFSLAKGFLTGKYRGETVNSPRSSEAHKYLNTRGERVLDSLDAIAYRQGVGVASVALAWLREQPTVVAPLASARDLEQVKALITSMSLDLSPEELAALSAASDV